MCMTPVLGALVLFQRQNNVFSITFECVGGGQCSMHDIVAFCLLYKQYQWHVDWSRDLREIVKSRIFA